MYQLLKLSVRSDMLAEWVCLAEEGYDATICSSLQVLLQLPLVVGDYVC